MQHILKRARAFGRCVDLLPMSGMTPSTLRPAAAEASTAANITSPLRYVADMQRRLCASTPQGATSSPAREKDMLMLFTCTKCDTRAGKAFSKQAYEHGLVIVTCPGCDSRHLIADNLGWMGDNGNIEDIMREKGQDAVRLTADGTVEVDPELFVGRSTVDSLRASKQPSTE